MTSEYLRCKSQIRSIGVSVVMFLIVAVMLVSIPEEEMRKLMEGKKMVTTPATATSPEITINVNEVMPETTNKVMASIGLSFIASVIFVVSVLMAINKSCYKTSLFSLVFGSLFGIL